MELLSVKEKINLRPARPGLIHGGWTVGADRTTSSVTCYLWFMELSFESVDCVIVREEASNRALLC